MSAANLSSETAEGSSSAPVASSSGGLVEGGGSVESATSAEGNTTTEVDVAPANGEVALMHLETGEDGLAGIQFFAFDTLCSIKAYTSEDVLETLYNRCVYFDEHLSDRREGSDIYRINTAGGAPVEVAPETADVIQRSLAYCESSQGLLDITIGAASQLWDFKEGVVPDAAALAEAIKHINWRNVVVDGNTVQLTDPQAKLDLGAVAKGYIADNLAAILSEEGCTGAIISLGGNVYALGTKADGSPWNVGIQDPNSATGTVIGSTRVSNTSVVTSGLYERNFESAGQLYYHILDPETGYPAETDLLSSTILSSSSLDGDAYSTILFLQGADGALETLESNDNFEGLLITSENEVKATRNLAWEDLRG